MASRLARAALGASRAQASLFVRPSAAARPMPLAAIRASSSDSDSNKNTPVLPKDDPKSKAQSLIDALPGNSLVSKSAILSSAAAVSLYAISNEYYVFNEETVVMACLLAAWGGLFKFGGPLISEFAEDQAAKMKAIFRKAREDNIGFVQTRIDEVKQMGTVVDVTKTLFEVSRETAKLEAQAYELEQKTALALEAKTVLESWVRYEMQVKQRQQKEMAEAVISKVQKELENPRVLQQILQQSVSDVERIVGSAKL